ncbi:RNB domain-containing protein [Ditylenchus destructor]|nr:RNB domain-containing protein [Ditylenchus destructor]
MVCDMLVTEAGELHAYQFYPAVINSHARFTYTEVAAILGNTHGPEAHKRKTLVPHLLHLHEVYRALLSQRGKRGAVDFETTETQIICDDAGRIEKIVPRTRNEAHRLIEEAMLAANVCSADFIAEGKHPGLYRVHEGPTPEKRGTLQAYLRALGIGMGISDDPTPGEFQAIAEATKDRPDAQQIHTMLLRSMQQAIYTPANSGHFGLAYQAYTHFTSPDPALSGPAGPPRDQGAAGLEEVRARRPQDGRGEPDAQAAGQARVEGADTRVRIDRGGALGSRGRALQRQRAPRRRGLPRCRGLAQVPLHARSPGRGVRRHRQRRDQLRPVRGAGCALCRGPDPHHRARRRVLPLRRGAPGAARRTHGHPLRHRRARAGAGQPRGPGRSQDRLPPGAGAGRGAAAARRASRQVRRQAWRRRQALRQARGEAGPPRRRERRPLGAGRQGRADARAAARSADGGRRAGAHRAGRPRLAGRAPQVGARDQDLEHASGQGGQAHGARRGQVGRGQEQRGPCGQDHTPQARRCQLIALWALKKAPMRKGLAMPPGPCLLCGRAERAAQRVAISARCGGGRSPVPAAPARPVPGRTPTLPRTTGRSCVGHDAGEHVQVGGGEGEGLADRVAGAGHVEQRGAAGAALAGRTRQSSGKKNQAMSLVAEKRREVEAVREARVAAAVVVLDDDVARLDAAVVGVAALGQAGAIAVAVGDGAQQDRGGLAGTCQQDQRQGGDGFDRLEHGVPSSVVRYGVRARDGMGKVASAVTFANNMPTPPSSRGVKGLARVVRKPYGLR